MMGKTSSFFAIVVVVFAIAGLVTGSALYGVSSSPPSSYKPSSQSQPYDLTLIITDGNWFNGSTMYQPSFFVVQNGTLVSAANIQLPADTNIILTVLNYDNGTDALSQAMYSYVMGTANNSIFVANVSGITANQLQNPELLPSQLDGSVVTLVQPSEVSHSFTVISGNVFVNVPIMPHSLVSTSFTLPPGDYIWQCQCACGSTPDGWGGSMGAAGWMSGVVHVGNYSSPQKFYGKR